MRMSWIGLVGAALALSRPGTAQEAVTRTFEWAAQEAFEQGQGGAGVQRSTAGPGVTLYDTTLVEDDGPGISGDQEFLAADDRSPTVTVKGDVRIKKLLEIDRPEALEARLYARGGARIEVNGTAVDTDGRSRCPAIPPHLLKKGGNVFILSSDRPVPVKIASRAKILKNAPERADRPCRSFVSTDGGKTWKPVDGEFMVRLHLLQYRDEGSFCSPVVSLGGEGWPLSGIRTAAVALEGDADLPKGTSLEFSIRSGTGPTVEPELWSEWRAPGPALPEGHRYVQWKATLRSRDPRATPVLKKVALKAQGTAAAAPAWAGLLRVVGFHNEDIRHTGMPFEYENPRHPRLVELRKQYRLDDVVAEAKSEFGQLVRLRHWAATQFKFKAPTEPPYPAWDAHEILERKIGFCVQFAIVYMQAALSLGHQARFVFGWHPGLNGNMKAGHEVCEVWSNEYRKWVLMDVSSNLHYVDPKTGEPLSLLETHDRMVRLYYGEDAATYERRPRGPKYSDEIAVCRRGELAPSKVLRSTDVPDNPEKWPEYTKWLHIRFLPRNNLYSRPRPAPYCQGWHWDFTGYWIWYDRQTPRDWYYPHVTSRRADLHWTLNQVRFGVTPAPSPFTLHVLMGTVTPDFDTFLAKTDDQDWRPAARQFSWALHPGRNRLEMRVRNRSGILGPVSFLEVER